MDLGVQHFIIVLVLIGYGGFYVVAAMEPDRRFTRWTYWHWMRTLFKWGRPSIIERGAHAAFGATLILAGLFVATLHLV